MPNVSAAKAPSATQLDPLSGLPPMGVGLRRSKPKIPTEPVPRVALTREQAAEAIGMSLDSFERYVQPEIRLIRHGRLVLVDVEELRRWSSEAGERTIA